VLKCRDEASISCHDSQAMTSKSVSRLPNNNCTLSVCEFGDSSNSNSRIKYGTTRVVSNIGEKYCNNNSNIWWEKYCSTYCNIFFPKKYCNSIAVFWEILNYDFMHTRLHNSSQNYVACSTSKMLNESQ